MEVASATAPEIGRSASRSKRKSNVIRRRAVVALLAAVLAAGSALASSTATAASNCKMVQTADWPVRLERNQLIVEGAINGQKIGVMLDTGATRSLILRSATERLGLTRRVARGYRMFGVGGETHVEAADVDEFKIDQFTRRNWRLLVAGERDLGRDVAVLLGEDFLYQVDVEFDLAHGAVRLFQPKDCDGVSLAYWATEGASEVDIEAIYDAQPQIVLTIQINGQPVRAQLDSGAGTSVLDKSDAARLGITPETPGVVAGGKGSGLGGKSVDYWIGPFESVTIGNETISDTNIRFADLWKDARYTPIASHLPRKVEGTASMLLGADFLRAHRVLVAHSQRKVYFTYEGGLVFQRPATLEGSRDSRPFKGIGASCQYSSECSGDVGCISGQCQRFANTADRCQSHTECGRDEWCIGSPRHCQSRFTEGMACSKDADCEGVLKCLSDRCARRN
jgi:predicted aspartyl protease